MITRTGTSKFYPFLVYSYCPLISSIKSLLLRPGFIELCEQWRQSTSTDPSLLCDVYDGKVWQSFMTFGGEVFLAQQGSFAFILNIDWFQPFKHQTYSIGAMYLAIMNLPRNIRYKRENTIILGLIPGPSEPSLSIDTYLTPHISDLLSLWQGISLESHDGSKHTIRGALLCVACDLPARRKVCGFLSYNANLGCSRCYCEFGTGVFGHNDYSGFNRGSWRFRSNNDHREDVKKIRKCATKTARQKAESDYGCRDSCLLQLPYFDPVMMLIIDPMHNLYQGTAKSIFNKVWREQGFITDTAITEINKRISSLTVPPM